MYAPLGLVGSLGAIASLISIFVQTRKGRSRKVPTIALAVCCLLLMIASNLRPTAEPAAPASTVSATSAPAATPVPTATPAPADTPAPAATETASPAESSAETPAATKATAEATVSLPTEAPTEVPTAEPDPTIPPVSDEQLDEGYLDAWFDDSLMIGDSIAGGLRVYVMNERANDRPCLGSMRIVGVSGLTLQKALTGETKDTTGQVLFRSRFMTISEVVEITHAKRLFLMMGVRDLEWYSPERLIDVYNRILSIVKANYPDLKIYIHSIMPTLKFYAEGVNLTYAGNKKANELLRAFCEENGYTYIELADLVRDEDGFLKYEYSGPDYSFHPNDIAKAIWVRLLRTCARDEYYAGIWKPEEQAQD